MKERKSNNVLIASKDFRETFKQRLLHFIVSHLEHLSLDADLSVDVVEAGQGLQVVSNRRPGVIPVADQELDFDLPFNRSYKFKRFQILSSRFIEVEWLSCDRQGRGF